MDDNLKYSAVCDQVKSSMGKVQLKISKDDAGHVNKLSVTKKLKLRPNRVLQVRE